MRPYSEAEVASLREQRDLSSDAQQCPVCSGMGIRRYYRTSYNRSRPAISSYVWCPQCHSYTGSTGPALGRVVTSDPLAALPDAPTDGPGPTAMENFLNVLDRLWDEGLLPQEIIGHR